LQSATVSKIAIPAGLPAMLDQVASRPGESSRERVWANLAAR
jgi:hypothetical protein